MTGFTSFLLTALRLLLLACGVLLAVGLVILLSPLLLLAFALHRVCSTVEYCAELRTGKRPKGGGGGMSTLFHHVTNLYQQGQRKRADP